jgi:hypothetical protein
MGGMLAYKLLRYIIATNRFHFDKLEGKERVPDIGDHFKQYIIANHSPEKEKLFAAAKKEVNKVS